MNALLLAASLAWAAAPAVESPHRFDSSGPISVERGWLLRDGDLITAVGPDREGAYDVKDAAEPHVHPDPGFRSPPYILAIAKSKPDWTQKDLLEHLDHAIEQASRGDFPVTIVYENVQAEPTPRLRARLKRLRELKRAVFFLRYGRFAAPSM